MRNGAQYARRIKRLFNRLRRQEGKPVAGEPTDPTEQLIVSTLGVGSSQARGRKALRRLLEHLVDMNEIRVSSPSEIAGLIEDIVPAAQERAKALVEVLNAVFRAENEMSLASLEGKGRREARQYLEGLRGIDPYTVASIMLWSLGGHAIPVNEKVLAALRANDLVAPECGVSEVQGFLERHVSAADGRHFCLLIEKYAEQWDRSPSSRRTAKHPPARSKSTTRRRARKTRKTAKPSASARKRKQAPSRG